LSTKSGVGCTISCRCDGCKNTFGQKDGECFILLNCTNFFPEVNSLKLSFVNVSGSASAFLFELIAIGSSAFLILPLACI
jgi:hypothetical protein